MCQHRFIRYEAPAPFGALAQNLVNTYDPTHEPPEYLRSSKDLRTLLEYHDLPAGGSGSVDLSAVRELRDEVRSVFQASSASAAMQLINALLERAQIEVRMVRRGSEPRLDLCAASSARVVERLRTGAALNLAFLLERFGFRRFHVCAADPCEDVFVDVTKGGARRFCAVSCANRARVALFRQRQRAES
jgi:predicted RNA-binding Zn ribbon-like protein